MTGLTGSLFEGRLGRNEFLIWTSLFDRKSGANGVIKRQEEGVRER